MPVVPISELQYRAGTVIQAIAGGENSNRRVGNLLLDMIDTLNAGAGGGGDVVGPASAINNNVAVFDLTTGKLIKDGGQTIAQIIASATAGSGNVVGPASAVDSHIALFDTTTGKLIKDSGLLVSDLALAGNGLTKTGQTLSVLLDGATLAVSGSGVKVADLGIGTTQLAANAVTFAKMQTIGALSVVANATNSTAVPAALAASVDGQALVRSGTTLVFSTLAIGAFADGVITLAKLANIAGLSVVGNGTNSSAVPTALTGTTDQVFRVSSAGTTAGFGAINLASASAVSGLLAFANIANGSARSVFGRSANSSGVQASIAAGGAGQVLIDNGTTIGFGTLVAASFAAATVPLTALATQAALTVVANATNGTASPTAVAGTTDQVLRVSSAGTALGFGAINLASASAVSGLLAFANIADGSARSVFGRSANSSGVQASIAGGGANTVLVDNGTTISFTTLALGSLANISALSVLGNGTNGSAAVTALAAGTDGDVMRRSGTSVAFGAPNFAAQDITTTGNLKLGTNPAAAGALRLANAANINFRNVANSADLTALTVNATNEVVLGTTAGTGALLGATRLESYVGGAFNFFVGTASIGVRVPAIQYDNGVVSPVINQADENGAGVTGDLFVLQAQNSNGTTSTGGGLSLKSGTGTTASGALRLYAGANNQMSIFDSGIDIGCAAVGYTSTVVSPVLQQNTDASASVTGDTFTIHSQDCSGTTAVTAGALAIRAGNATGGSGTRNGGALTLASGTGATTDGNLTLSRGATWSFPDFPDRLLM